MRGEYRGNYTNLWPLMELPPHARRIRLARCGVNNIHGTTSACAENTGKTDGLKISGRNYLRMRGEYSSCVVGQDTTLELPPHARRILKLCGRPGYYLGTTSACAENTGCQSRPAHHSRNYLRMRGEYLPMASFFAWVLELPPHARRILGEIDCWEWVFGTTSACAENTLRVSPAAVVRWNYLRMRGEYTSTR